MKYESPLLPLTFTKREKRFFVHGLLEACEATAHCPNTGSLKSILDVPVKQVWLHDHGEGGTRKLRYTTEVVELPDGTLINIHTGKANTLVGEALRAGTIAELAGATNIKAEARFDVGGICSVEKEVKRMERGVLGEGVELKLHDREQNPAGRRFNPSQTANSSNIKPQWDAATRFDFHLTDAAGTPTWVEVKSVTLKAADGQAAFPDAVSERGRKHLGVLAQAVEKGHRAVQLYLVGRTDCTTFRPATEIDPAYAAELRRVTALGVQVLCYGVRFVLAENGAPTAVYVDKPLPVSL